MASAQVFGYLKDIFPQVDPRILKAVAIEHDGDLNMAVDFILSNVAPSTNKFAEASYTGGNDTRIHDKKNSGGESSSGFKKFQLPFETAVRGDDSQHGISQTSPKLNSMKVHIDPAVDVNDVSVATKRYDSEDVNILNGPRNYSNVSAAQQIQGPSKCPGKEVLHHTDPIDTMMASVSSSVEVLGPKVYEVIEPLAFKIGKETANAGSQYEAQFSISSDEKIDFIGSSETGIISADENIPSTTIAVQSVCPELLTGCSSGLITSKQSFGLSTGRDDTQLGHALTSTELISKQTCADPVLSINDVSVEHSTMTLESQNYMNIINEDVNNNPNGSVTQETKCSDERPRIDNLSDMETIDTITAPVSSSVEFFKSNIFEDTELLSLNKDKEIAYCTTEEEEQFLKNFDVKNDDFLTSGSGVMSSDISVQSTSMCTQSGHSINIELLEDFITDAKDNKKNLLSAMESVRNMITEVVHLEETAKKVKDEASNAGQDILSEAEELIQTLKRAKEENDRHAGEVYGEKSILATEARELQSRLLSLSDQKNKSLSIVDGIREALELRLVTAREEIAAAEQEKRERETLAHKSLKEQELIMESIVEESKRLHQEAEENSKLREFLMDRGRVVDALQGEMAVIFEDVLTLKKKVEGHLPLNGSMRFEALSQVSSLNSSYSRSEHSSGAMAPQEGSETNSLAVDREHDEMQRSESKTSSNYSLDTKQNVDSGDEESKTSKKHSAEDDWELFEMDMWMKQP